MVPPRAPLLHRFAPHVAELPVARRALREWLTAVPSDPDAVEELLVQSLCDELTTVLRGRSRFVRCRKRVAVSA